MAKFQMFEIAAARVAIFPPRRQEGAKQPYLQAQRVQY
jgi:hypothetical protein